MNTNKFINELKETKRALTLSLLSDVLKTDHTDIDTKKITSDLVVNVMSIKSIEEENAEDRTAKIRVLANLLNREFYGYERPEAEEVATRILVA